MIVRNYSHLSQAMRNVLMAGAEDAPARATRQSTVDSLVNLGFAIDAGNRWITRTQAGKQARAHFLADVPAKIAVHLDKARDAGLTVSRSEDSGTLKSWTIASENPVDQSQVWLYWSPGGRGGRVGVTLYYGRSTKRHARIKDIHFAIQDMSESLQRYRQREAAKAAATGVTVEQAQAALGQVFAELDGAVLADIPAEGIADGQHRVNAMESSQTSNPEISDPAVRAFVPAVNLLHEELNLSTVHANDGTDRPLCGAPILGGEMTAVTYPVDCAACLKRRTLDCGCPEQIVIDEGHQEGCEIRDADPLELMRAGFLRAALCGQTAPPLGDPTRPGWFLVGQHIYDHDAQVHAEVVHIDHGANGNVEAVAVVTNGGYGGRWYWYGEKPGSIGGLDRLEGPHVGLTDRDRRPWPSHLRSVVQRVNMTLRDQMLSGWATTVGESVDLPAHVVINLPVGLDPQRHLILLARYIPYRVTVQARNNTGEVVGPTLIIRPKED